jgi:hypothetical protein
VRDKPGIDFSECTDRGDDLSGDAKRTVLRSRLSGGSSGERTVAGGDIAGGGSVNAGRVSVLGK